MQIDWPTSSDAMDPIGGSRLIDFAYPTWCMCTPTPSNPISRKQYRSQAVRDVPACNSSTCAGGAGWWDNLLCLLLNSGLSLLFVCLLLPALYVLVSVYPFARALLCWLCFRFCLHVHALLCWCCCCCLCLSSSVVLRSALLCLCVALWPFWDCLGGVGRCTVLYIYACLSRIFILVGLAEMHRKALDIHIEKLGAQYALPFSISGIDSSGMRIVKLHCPNKFGHENGKIPAQHPSRRGLH